jgi:hypothetical protein
MGHDCCELHRLWVTATDRGKGPGRGSERFRWTGLTGSLRTRIAGEIRSHADSPSPTVGRLTGWSERVALRSSQRLDHRDQVFAPVTLSARKADQLADLGEHGTALRGPGDGDAPAPLEVEDALVSEGSERPEDGVRVNAEHRRHVARGREALTRPRVTLGDVAPDLRGHLLVQRDGLFPGDLDFHHGDRQSITIMITEEQLRTEPPSTEPELVIREARRRQRRRRLGVFGIALFMVASGVIAAKATSAGRSGPPARPPSAKTPVRPAKVPAPPAAPVFSAGAFAGTWRVHTTSVTMGADGTGTATSPGPISPGGSEATAVPNGADLRLTAVNGTQATGVVSGSTDQAELPDGPVRLQVTIQDLLLIVPSQPVTVTPLRWTRLCGASASALTLAQQVAAGINCGA